MTNTQAIYQNITEKLANFRPRSAQLDMVMAIDSCFSQANASTKDGSNIALIEAPTGTGKSLAYLTAGIVNAKAIGKKLVISTATKVLQSQLVNKDLPLFKAASGLNFTFGLAKGRGNYLCPVSLELSLVNHTDMFVSNQHTHDKLTQCYQLFNAKAWDGDIDASPIAIDSTLKAMITTDKDRCLNYSCAYNQKDNITCPFYLKRESLSQVDVIITNHSLLLADINLPEGAVLPVKPTEYLLCIDEAHNFVDYAISSATSSFIVSDILINMEGLAKFLYSPQSSGYVFSEVALIDQLLQHNEDLLGQLTSFQQLLQHNVEVFKNNILILNDYISPDLGAIFSDVFINFVYVSNEMSTMLNNLLTKIKEKLKAATDESLNNTINRLGFYISKVDLILKTATYIINKDDSRYNANAKWVDIVTTKDNDIDFKINAGLTHVGNLLQNKLWSKVHAALLTSATLYITDEFNYYKFKLGLNLLPKVHNLRLATSFIYKEQSQIVVPQFTHAPEFNNKDQFNQELSKYLDTTLNYKEPYGTLVLFFNKGQLNDVYANLSAQLKESILLQSAYLNTHKLLKEHRDRIDKGQKSIIFGLNAFSEGVDLPSLYCMHVIITKIPFETFNTPHNLVQDYWIKFEKGNSFAEIALPEACIKLIQSSGRLIRSEDDYGQLSICDNRIVTKAYGQALLRALPKFNRKYNKEFLSEAFVKLSPMVQ